MFWLDLVERHPKIFGHLVHEVEQDVFTFVLHFLVALEIDEEERVDCASFHIHPFEGLLYSSSHGISVTVPVDQPVYSAMVGRKVFQVYKLFDLLSARV